MDYVEWCDGVLRQVIELTRQSPMARSMGIDADVIAQAVGINVHQPGYVMSPQWNSILETLQDLDAVYLLRCDYNTYWKATDTARQYVENPIPFWTIMCATKLEQDQEDFLRVVNRLSPEPNDGLVRLVGIPGEDLVRELEWAQDNIHLFHVVANELHEQGLISGIFFLGTSPNSVTATATYRGLVWETRRKFTAESQYIDQLVAAWETTSVEFKRDVQLDARVEEAEFVKDILGLVNTQASSPHLLVIGFDDKTHEYYGAPNPRLTQDWIERVLTNDTAPMVEAHYRIADYRKGSVGIIEVVRDPSKLPYRVGRTLGDKSQGDKKCIVEGQMFVRHGSQTEEPKAAELVAIIAEGKRARGEPVTNSDD